MSENETSELISGPGSLDEYLIRRSNSAMAEMNRYKPGSENLPSMKEATRAIFERKKKEFETMDKAREALAAGDNEPGLRILRQEINEIGDAIKHNNKIESYEEARAQQQVLVTLQMLLEDETGVPAKYYGYREGSREVYYLPDSVSRSDIVNVGLFKTVMAFGSYNPPTSGYYPTPDSVNPDTVISKLFDYDCGLTDEEKKLLANQTRSIKEAVKQFATDKFKDRDDRSLPMFPNSEMKPHEIIRYKKYNEISNTPNATFYIEDSEIKCRFSIDKKRSGQVFDLAQPDENLDVETVAKIVALPEELQTKIISLLNSGELKDRWQRIVPRTEKPDVTIA